MRTIIERLHMRGYEVYIVGGAVRDLIRGKPPKDVDLVTNATPTELRTLFEDDHNLTYGGTQFLVTFIDGIEVATYRHDLYKQGNLIGIKRAKTIEEDLARRDLTINAVAMHPVTGDIIDMFNSVNDIHNGIIQFVGDPKQRIMEDPVRILRACRFYALLNGKFETQTLRALKEYSHLIQVFPPERIALELIKAMQCPKASLFFTALRDIDGLKYIFPSLNACTGVDGGAYHNETVFEHNMLCGDSITCRKPMLKLAGYLHDVGKPACISYNSQGGIRFRKHDKRGAELVFAELSNLRFSKECIRHITALVEQHMRVIPINSSGKAVRKLLRDLKMDGITPNDFMRLRIADVRGNLRSDNYTFSDIKLRLKQIDREMCTKTAAFSLKDLTINGNDVMTVLGIGPGPKVGDVLNKLFDKVVGDPSLNERETLIGLIKEESV